jgi:signal peptidase I
VTVKIDEKVAAEPGDTPKPKGETKRKHPFLSFLGEIPGLILMALVLAILIKTFLVQAFYIPSPSMVPTLKPDDRVLVTRIPYYFHDPERGDIVVFEDPNPSDAPDRGVIGGALHWLIQKIGVEKPDNEDFIKRVIGLPGDTVSVKHGDVFVNGEQLKEPYLTQSTRWPEGVGKVTVPEGMLFVMGDNRGNSLDSRYGLGVRDPEQGGVGFIPIDSVIGKAFVIVWPTDRWGGV